MKIKQLLILVLIVLCGNILLTFTHLPNYLGLSPKGVDERSIPPNTSEILIDQLKGEILAIESKLLECELNNTELNYQMENFETLLDEKYVELDRLAKKMREMKRD